MTRPEPWPRMVIPFPEMVTPDVQVQLPAGTTTVSPLEAELIAFCRSVGEHDPALIVAALAGRTLIAAITIASTDIHLTVFNENALTSGVALGCRDPMHLLLF